MTFLYSIILGLVQGITEFLPISSTGHLVILRKLTGISGTDPFFWEVFLHFGTTMAVTLAYFADISILIKEAVGMLQDGIWNIKTYIRSRKTGAEYHKKYLLQNNNRRLVLKIMISTIPTAIIGISAARLVEESQKTTLPAALGFFVTGLFLLVVDRIPKEKKTPRELTMAHAMWLGIFQGICVFPGLSRLGITASVLVILGVSRKYVVKYSFLILIPSMWGALLLEMFAPVSSGVTFSEGVACVFGGIVAAVTGFFVLQKSLKLVQRRRLRYFAYYCLIAGTVAALVFFLK